MNSDNNPPRKRKPVLKGPQAEPEIRPDVRDQPAAAERTEEPEPAKEKDEDRQTPDVTSVDRQPVTNEDEQERITNTTSGNRPIPEK